MTNGQINFVHDLVQMAKAFEELPQVQAELDGVRASNAMLSDTIQRLELRLIDLKAELDAAYEATRKVEVERDHAERMFLETDDRLNAFRRLLAGFQAEAGALVAAAEPEPQPEPVSEALPPQEVNQVPVDPTSSHTTRMDTASTAESTIPTTAADAHEVRTDGDGVSVQPDPTPGLASSGVSAWSGSESSQHEGPSDTTPTVLSSTSDGGQTTGESGQSVVDPTASSEAGDGHSPVIATQVTDVLNADGAIIPVSNDDVGYHNEPAVKTGDGLISWQAWDDWCKRMNDRYGQGHWPARPGLASA